MNNDLIRSYEDVGKAITDYGAKTVITNEDIIKWSENAAEAVAKSAKNAGATDKEAADKREDIYKEMYAKLTKAKEEGLLNDVFVNKEIAKLNKENEVEMANHLKNLENIQKRTRG